MRAYITLVAFLCTKREHSCTSRALVAYNVVVVIGKRLAEAVHVQQVYVTQLAVRVEHLVALNQSKTPRRPEPIKNTSSP